MISIVLVILILGGILSALLSITIRLLKKPMKWVLKFLIHAAMGYVFLFLFNFVGAWVNLHLDITWVSAVVTGFLGIPGVLILLLAELLL